MSGRDIIRMACRGEKDAERFCLSWLDFAHLVDDCADGDKPVDAKRLGTTFLAFVIELSANPFYQKYKAQLLGLMVQATNAWLDSNSRQGVERDVLKGFYHEVIFHVAFLVGGWVHLRAVTAECRSYDFEEMR